MGKRSRRAKLGPIPIQEISFDHADVHDKKSCRKKSHKPSDSTSTVQATKATPPSKNELLSLVDILYSKANVKTMKLSDIYNDVEKHFGVELDKADRKIVRQRLGELNSKTREIQSASNATSQSDIQQSQNSDALDSLLGDMADGSDDSSEEILFVSDSSRSLIDSNKLFHNSLDVSDHDPNDKTPLTDQSQDPSKPSLERVEESLHEHIETGSADSGSKEALLLQVEKLSVVAGTSDRQRHRLRDVHFQLESGQSLFVLSPDDSKATLLDALCRSRTGGCKTYGKMSLNGVDVGRQMGLYRGRFYSISASIGYWPALTLTEALRFVLTGTKDASKADQQRILVDLIRHFDFDGDCNKLFSSLSQVRQRQYLLAVAIATDAPVIVSADLFKGLSSPDFLSLLKAVIEAIADFGCIGIFSLDSVPQKVFVNMDQTLILTKGRVVYCGAAGEAENHFASVGYSCPEHASPVEHILDTVNINFSGHETVDYLLEKWREVSPATVICSSIAEAKTSSRSSPCAVVYRQVLLLWRHPGPVMGRLAWLLIANALVALAFWDVRSFDPDQLSVSIWFLCWVAVISSAAAASGMPSASNEFRMVHHEWRNGLTSILVHEMSRLFWQISVIFLYALAAIGVSGYAILNLPPETFGIGVTLLFMCLLTFEFFADFLPAATSNESTRSTIFLHYLASSLIFNGITLAPSDMIWPFKVLYYLSPFQYFLRSFTWELLDASDDGRVVQNINSSFLESTSSTWQDMIILLSMAVGFKTVGACVWIWERQKSDRIEKPLVW